MGNEKRLLSPENRAIRGHAISNDTHGNGNFMLNCF
jgi:hypothetical protein